MSPVKALLIVSFFSFLVIGCKPKNPDLYGVTPEVTPPKAQDKLFTGDRYIPADKPVQQALPEGTKVDVPPTPAAEQLQRYTQVDAEVFKPKVDILFVTDTSDSMKTHQAKLRKNINEFSKNFLRKKDFLDFHIGVVGP